MRILAQISSQCALDSLLDCITWWSRPNSFTSVKLEKWLKTPFGTLQKNLWPVLAVYSSAQYPFSGYVST